MADSFTLNSKYNQINVDLIKVTKMYIIRYRNTRYILTFNISVTLLDKDENIKTKLFIMCGLRYSTVMHCNESHT